jgi:O-antigen/teichoic acid export membrane protein
LLLPGSFGWTAVSLTSAALVARNAPGRSSIGISVALVTGIVLDLVLMPPFGASGAAAASSAAFIAGGVAGLVTYRKIEPFELARLAPARADLAFLRRLVPLRTTESRG